MSNPAYKSTLRRSSRTQAPLERYTPAPIQRPTTARHTRRKAHEISPDKSFEHLPKRQVVGPSEADKESFIQELRIKGINESKLKIIKDFLLKTSYSIAHSRGLTNDFMKIIAKEAGDKAKIFSNIGKHCRTNLGMNPICFCCGEKLIINEPKTLACDHVIPIISMLMTVTPETVPNNLHYIHKSCNAKKSDKNILEVFNEIGKPGSEGGIFKCSNDNTILCKKMFIDILESITFRPEVDIQHRLYQIEPFNREVRNLIDKFELYFNDIKAAANILIGMSRPSSTRSAPAFALAKGKKVTQRKKNLLHNPNIRRKNSRKPRRKISRRTRRNKN
tara:strand:- start:1472 stop:2470 length:999 start_codon:yes stop_codon:yes gene_type:complete